MAVFTVSQVTHYLKESLEQDSLLSELWINGEISNLKTSAAGHSYYTLKDADHQLRSVMFKSGKGSHLMVEGGLVTAHGRVTFYEVRGEVEFITDLVMPEGTGPLFLELEQLKMRLEEEGLFEVSRKRPIPRFPKVIGLVTSPSGAVLHDIINILSRRYPLVEVLLAPTQVQGEAAAKGIVLAIQQLNQEGRSDVIIVARGGGSLEELWPFNEEVVARAVYASRIPVISAVGHETDYTISDLVADQRAPTPSAAAEMVVPDARTLAQDIGVSYQSIRRLMSYQFDNRRQETAYLAQQLKIRAPDTATWRRRVDDLAKSASGSLTTLMLTWRGKLNASQQHLQALNPIATLSRGYSIVQKQPNGATTGTPVVSSTLQVSPGEVLNITVSDGAFSATTGNPTRKPRVKKPVERAGAKLL